MELAPYTERHRVPHTRLHYTWCRLAFEIIMSKGGREKEKRKREIFPDRLYL